MLGGGDDVGPEGLVDDEDAHGRDLIGENGRMPDRGCRKEGERGRVGRGRRRIRCVIGAWLTRIWVRGQLQRG
jgi:hypothetical protein